jgi:Rieske Fe-S protein
MGAPTRREFVARAAGIAAAALGALGLTRVELDAMPVAIVEGEAAGANERAFPIPPADAVNIDKSAQAIIVRFQNRAYAFALSCPHQNFALKWLPKDGRFQCPKHESKYKPDGTFMEGRATRNMDRFAVRKDSDKLIVNLASWFESDKNPQGWAAAFVQL